MADADFVRQLALSLGLDASIEARDLSGTADNLEQAGRNARQDFFLRLRATGLVQRIATGHTRSDQAETVLYRLLRGSGTAGMAGVLPVTGEGIVRPLLDCSRAEVDDFLRSRGLAWREDATNGDPSFVRNRIRHQLLPALARDFNPAVAEVLAATAALAGDEEDYWRARVSEIAAKLFIRKGDAVLMRTTDLLSLHPAEARRVVRQAILNAKNDLRGIDIGHIERVLELAARKEGHGRTQAPGIDVFRSFEWLRLARPQTQTRWERDYSYRVGEPPDTLCIGETSICLEIQDLPNSKHYNGRADELEADALGWPLELRNWHPGDEFQPVGRSRTRIKSLFQEGRVPIWERHGWPVLVSGSEIVWTRDFGAAEAFVARNSGRGRILRVSETEAPGQSRESNQAF